MSECVVCGRPEWDGVSANMKEPECGRSVGGAWSPNYAKDCYQRGYARLESELREAREAAAKSEREWCKRRDDAIAAYIRSLDEKDRALSAERTARRGMRGALVAARAHAWNAGCRGYLGEDFFTKIDAALNDEEVTRVDNLPCGNCAREQARRVEAERERDEAQQARDKAEGHRAAVALRYHGLQEPLEDCVRLMQGMVSYGPLKRPIVEQLLARARAALAAEPGEGPAAAGGADASVGDKMEAWARERGASAAQARQFAQGAAEPREGLATPGANWHPPAEGCDHLAFDENCARCKAWAETLPCPHGRPSWRVCPHCIAAGDPPEGHPRAAEGAATPCRGECGGPVKATGFCHATHPLEVKNEG